MADAGTTTKSKNKESVNEPARQTDDYVLRVRALGALGQGMKQCVPCFNFISFTFGVWLSLVERLVRDQEAGSSNLLTPTIKSRAFHNALFFMNEMIG